MAKIAIVGSGISGLSASYLLNRHHDIVLYEKAPRIGGHSHTVDLDYDGAAISVDIGFIVFNRQNYPHLTGMFEHLDVPTHKSDMTFAASIGDGAFEWGADTVNTVIGQRRNLFRPRFYRLLRDVTRFNRHALDVVQAYPEWTLDQLVAELRLGEEFCRYYILPMSAAIWSCPPRQMREFPARTLIQFFVNHNLMSMVGQPQWYTVTGGSKEYVRRLTVPFANKIRKGCGAVSVARHSDGVVVAASDGSTERFDDVVFACHGDEILPMLADASDRERAALGGFRFQPNQIVLHKDASVMPRRRRCWASWNYKSDGSAEEPAISVSYWMNRLQGIRQDRPLFVSLNPSTPIADEHVFLRQEFSHPIFDHPALAAQVRVKALQGVRRTWFCGAWLRHGFHEDGLSSAVAVAERMGISPPWQTGQSVTHAVPEVIADSGVGAPIPALAAQ